MTVSVAQRHVRHSALVAGAGALVVLASACAGGGTTQGAASGSSGGHANAAKATSSAVAVNVRNTKLGKVLVDAKGRTLYMFTIDKGGKSNCTGACLKYWPVVTAPAGKPKEPSAVTAKLGVTTARNGSRQLTAGGWPLYLYAGDNAPGDIHGQGVKTFGGVWYALSPSGTPIKMSPKSKPSSSPSGGSGSSGGSGGGGGGGWA